MGVERYFEKKFVPYSKFFRVFITCFPSSIEQEQCLKTVTNSQPLASNLNNQFSQELGKQVTHTWKTFLTANLDNYSNKILFLWGVGDQRYFAKRLSHVCFIRYDLGLLFAIDSIAIGEVLWILNALILEVISISLT